MANSHQLHYLNKVEQSHIISLDYQTTKQEQVLEQYSLIASICIFIA